ncbi:class 1b ribonucleoside-diphosphate reductase subunit alpha [Mycoplasmopsis agassizii]|uniref:Ribonucleoside-diphosphate reductase n=1 Tax=Mycoplasmopsis agassizii TaxID=33922 RepID=A0ABX4H603_9BACT|nr:class 1b ribonucleoside-diphosphate reductase subunit alpha [Mycoplasmopsis agassizii]PAF55316.1 class 1b ribonucleoside-diphosphate reductase subunit alpha [Mycoplasmopsis agassizii]SMC15761.1 ribonucleoside-diphosphate reductase alpha chain [Mycoplasmopsis agassizii]
MSETKEIDMLNDSNDEYIVLNALARMVINGKNNFHADQSAVLEYMHSHVLPRTKEFDNFQHRIEWLIENEYYDAQVINQYTMDQLRELHEYAYSFKFEFMSFMGALKFYTSYALKTFDNSQYLEAYEDRVLMNALLFGEGKFERAKVMIKQMMTQRYQPATPTFLNAGKKQRGEYVSCFLLRVEDNMESIARGISTSLQLSKRGGGVALSLSNVREAGAPIKNIQGQATGVLPVMKLLEDSFSYANQLGQRQGAGAVYLHAHHPDIMAFLDTKKENADEKIRIKSLSLGIVVPDITFKLAAENKDMALFSPYDVFKAYGKTLNDISVTEEYDNLVKNPNINKTYINARKLFQTIAQLHFESGYPYLLFDDTVNAANPNPGRVVMSNLCSEIVQSSSASEYSEDLSYTKVGEDVACNLGSINIARAMEAGAEFGEMIEDSIIALDVISRLANVSSAPSVEKGNSNNNALGLGAMNMHGFLATNEIYYNSPEALDFTNIYFYTTAYHAFRASNNLAINEKRVYKHFKNSKYADGSYFEKYTKVAKDEYLPKTEKIKEIFAKYNVAIPSQQDWIDLVEKIKKHGLANSHLMAIAPTGSISYLSSCTASLQPIVSPVEVRKEGKVGRVYVPAYKIDDDNLKYYQDGAYELGPDPIIDLAAEAQKHVDQAISLTLFVDADKTTTRDLNKAYIRAFKKKCKSIYYVRIRQEVIDYMENIDCESCVI